MESQTKVLLGTALVAGGLGAGIWVWQRYAARQAGLTVGNATLGVQPPEPLPLGAVAITATLSWTNTTSQAHTYGVQGVILQAPPVGPAGLVGGHWWTSQAALQQALQLAAGDMTRYVPFAADPQNRVAAVTVQPGQTGHVQLFSRPQIVPGEVWLFWIRPTAGGLLTPDPLGTSRNTLPVPQVDRQVQVR